MICVFGSINVDLVCRTATIARPGETVLSSQYDQYPGGKGANQAVAASRVGARVEMVGAIGADGFGDTAKAGLLDNGVGIGGVAVVGLPTGCAFIVVAENGENAITVASGANQLVTSDYSSKASTLVIQMELAADVTLRQMEVARQAGVRTVLNFAPVPGKIELSTLSAILSVTDHLIVNEHELIALCDRLGIRQDAALLAKHVKCWLVVTCGSAGIILYDPATDAPPIVLPAPTIDVMDTTGAGDTFVGVYAAGLDAGLPLREAAQHAMFAASLACRSEGAQSAMPTNDELQEFIISQETV